MRDIGFSHSLWKITVFHDPSCLSLFMFLITFLLDTEMEKTLLSMGEIIDFCSVRATMKTEDHSAL